MNQIKNNIEGHFTLCPNELINQRDLSIQSRFVFVWMASRPDDWIFLHEAAATALGVNLQTFRKYVNELIDAGWITRIRLRNEKDGSLMHYLYEVHPSPVTKKPPVVKPLMVNPTDIYKKEDTNKDLYIEREREQFTEVMRYYRAKVNNRWEVSTNGKYRKRLSDLIHQGRAISDIKKVIDHRFEELENGLPQYLVEPDNIFKHDLFLKTLNAANFKPAQKPKAVNGKNSGIQLAGEQDFKGKPSGWENYGI